MKIKYNVVLKDGSTKDFYLKKYGKRYVAYLDGKEYSPFPSGSIVTFNGIQRIVDNRIIFFDLDGIKFVTYFNNWAAPKLTMEQGIRVKSNTFLNNFKIGLPLFIAFIVIMIVVMVLMF